jgi:hypothetical protein
MEVIIPAKDYNAELGKMENTSLPHWQQYYADLQIHVDKMEAKKPLRENYGDGEQAERAYQNAKSEWHYGLSLRCSE